MSDVYLTQLTLNPYAKEVRRSLEDRYTLHRIAYSLKGEGQESRQDDRLLWRLEPVNGRGRAVMLVQTPHPPDMGYVLERRLGRVETRGVDLRPAPGVFSFRIEANAAKRNVNRARPLLQPDEQIEWLKARLAPLEVLEVVPVRTVAYDIKKPGGSKYKLNSVLYEGRLAIPEGAEAEARRLLLEGIGRARSMGLGMLSLKRVR